MIGLALVLVVVLGGTAIGFAVSVAVESGRTPPPRAPTTSAGSPVLLVKGFNSRWDGVTYRWVLVITSSAASRLADSARNDNR